MCLLRAIVLWGQIAKLVCKVIESASIAAQCGERYERTYGEDQAEYDAYDSEHKPCDGHTFVTTGFDGLHIENDGSDASQQAYYAENSAKPSEYDSNDATYEANDCGSVVLSGLLRLIIHINNSFTIIFMT